MQKQPAIKARSTSISRPPPEKLRYFYHPDHIGSTSWVTDSAKNGIQYCEYLPYKKLRFFSSLAFGKTNEFVLHSLPASVGEPFLDQRSTTWNSRYTFSGKERDGETGYSYFGARYYNSDISIWLSVDPLSDKYPNLTPYAYCANNPIRLIDPDGQDWFENELTGAIYYNRDFTKEDVGEIGGGGWKWKGENGMFGKTDNDVLNSNISLASDWKVENSRETPITQAIFEGKGAEKFMSEMGYKQVPIQALEYSTSMLSMIESGSRMLRADIGGSIAFSEKVGYVPNDYSFKSKKTIVSETYPGIGLTPLTTTISRVALTYNQQSPAILLLSGIADFFKSGSTGNFDLRPTCPCVINQKYINQFLNKHGVR